MASFTVFSNSTIVGTSDLEGGDPPMGVASGRFFPADGYASIRSACLVKMSDQSLPSQSALNLSVRTSGGVMIECMFVRINDYSPELGAEGLELDVVGIPYPLYGELFPGHVATYEGQFK